MELSTNIENVAKAIADVKIQSTTSENMAEKVCVIISPTNIPGKCSITIDDSRGRPIFTLPVCEPNVIVL